MRSVTRLIQPLLLTLFMITAAAADEQAVVHKLLDDFLAGASINSFEQHDRFWADELIYTSSGGLRFGKAHIMEGVAGTGDEPSTEVYRADEVDIRIYDDTAIVAFKLVGESSADKRHEVTHYFNTGTLLKRNGQWRVVAWQATKIPAAQ